MWLLLDESRAGLTLDYIALHAADRREAREAIDRAMYASGHRDTLAAHRAKVDRAIRAERLRQKGRTV